MKGRRERARISAAPPRASRVCVCVCVHHHHHKQRRANGRGALNHSLALCGFACVSVWGALALFMPSLRCIFIPTRCVCALLCVLCRARRARRATRREAKARARGGGGSNEVQKCCQGFCPQGGQVPQGCMAGELGVCVSVQMLRQSWVCVCVVKVQILSSRSCCV